MDVIDRKLLNMLQKGLPLEKDPYAIIGNELGIHREDVLFRIKKLFENGYIRRLGGIFDTKAMGYSSILIGAHVPDDICREVTLYVNNFSGVTHNYLRNGFLNMWFTLSVLKEEEKNHFLTSFKEKYAIEDIYEFPKLRSFKLRVFFEMEGR